MFYVAEMHETEIQEPGAYAEPQLVLETAPELHDVDVHPEPQQVVSNRPETHETETRDPGAYAESQPVLKTLSAICDFFLWA